MASSTKEIVTDLAPLLRVYSDGTVDRLFGATYVPPSPEHPVDGVLSKDINITPEIPARIYLPNPSDGAMNNTHQKKLPIFVYFHSGGFCLDSAFSFLEHRYINLIASKAKSIIVSVEYRLAPEHLLPAAYEDSWTAIQWVAAHSQPQNLETEPWISNHGDLNRIYIGGDSSGGNMAHNAAVRAGSESLIGELKIAGAILSHPYFLGSKPIGSESAEGLEQSLGYRVWKFVYPSAPGGFDNPMINPCAEDAPALSTLGCSRLFVCTSGKDEGRDRAILYAEGVRESGWKGEMELVEVEGETHCFQIFNPETEKAKSLINRFAAFINQ